MSQNIRILIADDHAIVREGLRALFATEPDFELAAEAADGVEAVDKARVQAPDVILLDMMMPRKTGLEAIQEIIAENPNARILVLTSFAEDEKVFPAIKGGALGYLLKDSSPQELVQAVRNVYNGEASLHPTIARKLIRELSQPPSLPHARPPDGEGSGRIAAGGAGVIQRRHRRATGAQRADGAHARQPHPG